MKCRAFAPALMFVAGSVHAAPSGKTANADVAEIAAVACADDESGDRSDAIADAIAEGILYKAGYPTSRLFLGKTLDDHSRHDALMAVLVADTGDLRVDAVARQKVLRLAREFSQTMMRESHVDPKGLGLSVTSPEPANASTDPFWIFEPGNAVHFQCGTPKPAQTVEKRLDQASAVPSLGLLKNIADLGLSGADRKKADSATFGLKRTKTEKDDGTFKKDVTLTFDGTLGLRLTSDQAPVPVFAFANYSLSRDRTKPAAVLAAGKHRDDGDTNGLALGFAAPKVWLVLARDEDGYPKAGVTLDAQTSYVANFVKGSRRAVGEVNATPNLGSGDLGLCGVGLEKAVTIFGVTFRSRCYAAGDIAYSHVLKVGSADFKDHGNFLSAGIAVGIVLAPPIYAKDGVVASASYRYLPTISGRAPDIKRVDAALKYRWWLSGGAAFDLGGTYKHGEELKTYTREDSLLLTFGVIY